MIVLSCPIVFDRVKRAWNDPSLNVTSPGFSPQVITEPKRGPVLNEHPPGVNTQVLGEVSFITNCSRKNNMGESMRGACLEGLPG